MLMLSDSRWPLFLAIVVCSVAAVPDADGGVPHLINYQGRLTDSVGNAVHDASYTFDFALFADSTGGVSLWSETAAVSTMGGLFSHLLGSVDPMPWSLLLEHEALYLEITALGSVSDRRICLASVPYAQLAGHLEVRDANDTLVIKTVVDDRRLSVFGSRGQEQIRLQGNDSGRIAIFNPGSNDLAVELTSSFDSGGQLILNQGTGESGIILRGGVTGNEAVVVPDSAISSQEVLDESGFTLDVNVNPVTLVNMEMADILTIQIETPASGYVVLEGKCYVEFSGTTGPNVALVQIDQNQGGGSQFPYYALAGLGGYANSLACYFPVYVTRVYYKAAGIHEFRMEGRASYPPPAMAKTWDHVLTATYYSTGYGVVSKVATEPGDHPRAVPIDITDPQNPDGPSTYYQMDLRYLEESAKAEHERATEADR